MTARLRRIAATDATPYAALFPAAGRAVPTLFHYDPQRFYIEAIPHRGGRELVFTALSRDKLVPMIRYATGDRGGILSPQALAAALQACGQAPLQPGLPLPCAWVSGRAGGRAPSAPGPGSTARGGTPPWPL